ncbi:CopD family protein [Marinobacteraceae bacterium S3BR75-40.1]
MSVAISLHVLAAVIWVGGMFYAYMAMRPGVGHAVEPPRRPVLWCHTLSRFFRWVWLSILVLLGTGYWMVFKVFGGMQGIGLHVHLMQGLGIVMMLIFAHVYFAPFRRLKRAVEGNDNEAGSRSVAQIRVLVGTNLILGIAVVLIAAGGRYAGW